MHSLPADRWRRLCERLGVPAQDRFAQLAAAYAQPQRAYHTAQHIAECLALFDTLRASLHDPDAVELALWLHDLVYDPRRSDNEARSAEMAAQWFAALDPARLQRLCRWIEATRTHQPAPHEPDLQALLDIDLSILAASPERFAQYNQQVRQEYRFVPWPVYVWKRRQFLRQLAARQPLFHHPALAATLAPAARRNLGAGSP